MDLMTVPTNNEDALARELAAKLYSLDYQVDPDSAPTDDIEERLGAADELIAWFAARRLPVSGDNALSDEVLRQTYLDAAVIEHQRLKVRAYNLDSRMRETDRAGLRAVANLAASQPREVEPPKTENLEIVNGWLVERGVNPLDYPAGPAYGAQPYSDAEPLVHLSELPGWPREAAPSDVDGVLAMLDDLNASGGIAYDAYSRLHDAVALLGPAEPVRVEVTRAAFSRFVQSFNGDEAGDIDDVGALDGATGWAMRGGNDVRAVFEKAAAALGGGDQ